MHENLENWIPRAETRPNRINGKHVVLTAYKSEDVVDLWDCFGQQEFNQLAKYFPNPDFKNAQEFGGWLNAAQAGWHTMVFRDPKTGDPIGMASYMRMDPANGSVEVGSVCHAQTMQRSIAATEAHYLMAKHVFDDLGYRRYEWKLNNDNTPSHIAAKRLGFSFEGIFRNHIISKGKNRDTAWYAMINHDWPSRKIAFEKWLSDENFDANGMQIQSLINIREQLK